ncbi:hypothetical protein RI367_008034 [Sorochytrium milnesiophthora]
MSQTITMYLAALLCMFAYMHLSTEAAAINSTSLNAPAGPGVMASANRALDNASSIANNGTLFTNSSLLVNTTVPLVGSNITSTASGHATSKGKIAGPKVNATLGGGMLSGHNTSSHVSGLGRLPLFNLTWATDQVHRVLSKLQPATKHAPSFMHDSAKGTIHVTLSNGSTIAVHIPPRPRLPRKLSVATNATENSRTYTVQASESNISYVERFTLKTQPVPTFRAAFFTNNVTAVDYFHFTTGLHKLVEYNDTMSPENSTNVFSLANLTWTQWDAVTRLDDAGRNVLINVTSVATPSANFSIALEVILTRSQSAVVYGTTVAPRMVKYSLRVVNFPYTAVRSRLAVVKSLTTRAADSGLSLDALSGLTVGKGYGRFSWASTASLGGSTSANVSLYAIGNTTSTGLYSLPSEPKRTNESTRVLVFKVDAVQPRYLFWDPTSEMAEDKMSDDSAAMSMTMDHGSSTSSSATFGVLPALVSVVLAMVACLI